MIIDCHGHYTSEPPSFIDFRKQQIAAFERSSNAPEMPQIGDDQIREKLEPAQLKFQRERGTDVTIFSPRASAMGHHVGDAKLSASWTRICNDMIHRVVNLYPKNFIGVCQLPQIAGRAARQLHPRAGALRQGTRLRRLQPQSRPLGRILERAAAHRQVVVSALRKNGRARRARDGPRHGAPATPRFHTTGSHYINGDTTAFMQFLLSDLFKDFPTLKFVIPHGGGAVPYHWGRYRGIAQDMKRPPLKELLLNNVYFDTCVYHQPGIDCMTQSDPRGQHSLRLGNGRRGQGHRPRNRPLLRRHSALHRRSTILSAADKRKIFESNALKVYPRLAKQIQKQGIAAHA